MIGSIDAPYSVYAADVDGDGDMDVLAAAQIRADYVVWYENNGAAIGWTRHTIDSGFRWSPFSLRCRSRWGWRYGCVSRGQRSCWWISGADQIVWYENDGSGNFSGRQVIGSDSYTTSVIAADINNDGDMDVLGASDQNNPKVCMV